MNTLIKKNAKDPKILTIIALLTVLGVENTENITDAIGGMVIEQQENNDREPEIVIDGPDNAEEGNLIYFSASDSYGEHFTWDVSPPLEMRPTEDSRGCYFGSKPGEYTITLFVSNCKGQVYEKQSIIITSTDDCPDVPDVPDDPSPGELIGLAKSARDLAMSHVEIKYLKDAGKVAKVYESISTSNKHKDPQSMVSQTLIEIRNALGANVKGWTTWYAKMALELQKEVAAGKLVTVTQYQAAWKQIAEGLGEL